MRVNRAGLVVVVVGLGVGPALAQQQPQGDPALNVCQQLLGRANTEVIQMSTQATMLGRQLEETKAELARVRDELSKKTAPTPTPESVEPKP